jgi:hypothetical protein
MPNVLPDGVEEWAAGDDDPSFSGLAFASSIKQTIYKQTLAELTAISNTYLQNGRIGYVAADPTPANIGQYVYLGKTSSVAGSWVKISKGVFRASSKAVLNTYTSAEEGDHGVISGATTASENGDYVRRGTSWQRGAPYAQVTGTAVLPASASGNNKVTTVTFPTDPAFTVAPKILISAISITVGGAVINGSAENVSTTGFTLRVYNNGGNFTGMYSFDYTAIQATSVSAGNP